MTEQRKLRVFLCHASQDKPVVRELYQRLLAQGWIDPWLDEEKLLPGQDWDMEIEKAVESADAVIVCLSAESINKEGYVQRELRFALDIALEKPEGTIFIIPLRLGDCKIPRKLQEYQFLDFFPAKLRDGAFRRLVEALMIRSAPVKRKLVAKDLKTDVSSKPDFIESLSEDAEWDRQYHELIEQSIDLKQISSAKFFFDSRSADTTLSQLKKEISDSITVSGKRILKIIRFLLFFSIFPLLVIVGYYNSDRSVLSLMGIALLTLVLWVFLAGLLIGLIQRIAIGSELKRRMAKNSAMFLKFTLKKRRR